MNLNQMKSDYIIEKRAYINGKYVNGISNQTMSKVLSFDGTTLSGITACDKEDVDYAVNCAQKAFESKVWSGKSQTERKKVILKLADLMENHIEELASLDTYETNRAYKNYLYDSIPKAIEAIRYFAEGIDKYYDVSIPPKETGFGTITRCPLGVVGIITPWNDPLVVASWKFVPALLMGNSVIIKPAEQSSLSIIRVAQLVTEAGVPAGVFNVLPGYGEIVGKELALHMDVRGVFFTGSSEVGKKIIQYSGKSNMKKVGLECGGKSPFIVSDKCKNIKNAAKVLAESMFYNQGQICSAPSRVIVHKDAVKQFIDCLKGESERFIPGNPYDIHNEVGCIVSKEQCEKVKTYIEEAKKRKLTVFQAPNPQNMPLEACYVSPTIITNVNNDDVIAREEIFGPVVVILESENIKEAVSIANDTKYGLAAAIFTDDLNEAYYAANNLQAGLVHVNSYGLDDNSAPFGGVKESGIGKDKSMYAFDEYSQLKTVWVNIEN